jgi:hypothetical protein
MTCTSLFNRLTRRTVVSHNSPDFQAIMLILAVLSLYALITAGRLRRNLSFADVSCPVNNHRFSDSGAHQTSLSYRSTSQVLRGGVRETSISGHIFQKAIPASFSMF